MNVDTVSAQAWASDTPLAWAQCELPEIVAPPRWTRAWMKVAAAAVAVGSAAGAVLLLLNPPAAASGAVVVAAPAAVTVDPESLKNADPPPFVMPPPIMAAQETADGQLLTSLREMKFNVAHPAAAIDMGHQMCGAMAATGDDIAQATTDFVRASEGRFNTAQAHDLVVVSVTAYCPQYLERGLN